MRILLKKGFPLSSNVIRKRTASDFLLDVQEVWDWWAQDKLNRESAWLNLVAMLKQIVELTGNQVSDWRLHDSVGCNSHRWNNYHTNI